MKLLLTNLVYGEEYANLFLDQHLKSLLDPSNVPSVKDQIEYLIFTDKETLPKITKHANFFHLSTLVPVQFSVFSLGPEAPRFEARYSLLIESFKQSVRMGLDKGMLVSAMVADLVFARDYLPKLLGRFKQGYGSVFCLPLRSAAEAMIPHLDTRARSAFRRGAIYVGVQ